MKIILAVSDNNVIGIKDYDGSLILPWHLPPDLARFAQITKGCKVAMGRKTWESLPFNQRHLKYRDYLVLTSDHQRHIEGAYALSFENLIASHQDAWVIGGREIYDLAAPYVDYAVVTRVHVKIKRPDNEHLLVYGPNLSYLPKVSSSPLVNCPLTGVAYTFETRSR